MTYNEDELKKWWIDELKRWITKMNYKELWKKKYVKEVWKKYEKRWITKKYKDELKKEYIYINKYKNIWRVLDDTE